MSYEQRNRKTRLTRSILFDLLRRDGKDTQYFDHYLHHCALHLWCWWDLSINLKPSEEVFDLFQNFDEGTLVFIQIFSRLFQIRKGSHEGRNEVTYQEENTNACKYHCCGWEYLPQAHIAIRARTTDTFVDVYQANASTKRGRECVQNINRWV